MKTLLKITGGCICVAAIMMSVLVAAAGGTVLAEVSEVRSERTDKFEKWQLYIKENCSIITWIRDPKHPGIKRGLYQCIDEKVVL